MSFVKSDIPSYFLSDIETNTIPFYENIEKDYIYIIYRRFWGDIIGDFWLFLEENKKQYNLVNLLTYFDISTMCDYYFTIFKNKTDYVNFLLQCDQVLESCEIMT